MIEEKPRNSRLGKFYDNLDMIQQYSSSEIEWARFCLHPDIYPPARMPSFFPLESHISTCRLETSIRVPAGDSFLSWYPENYRNGFSVHLPSLKVGTDVNTGSPRDSAIFYKFLGTTENWVVNNQADTYPTNLNTRGMYQHLVEGGCRLVGAVLKIDYLGKADDTSGMIEVAANIENTHNAKDLVHISTVGGLDGGLSSITQSPYYQKLKTSEGCRVVWLPIDNSKFDFRQPLSPASVSTDPQQVPQYNYLRDPIQLTWVVHFTGFAVPSEFRLSIVQFYECIPAEEHHDIFNPQKGPSGDIDNARKIIHQVSKVVDNEGRTAVSGASRTGGAVGYFKRKLYEIGDQLLSPANMLGVVGGLLGTELGPGGMAGGFAAGEAIGRFVPGVKFYK